MKKVVLYLLLFTYTISVIKPLLPFAADAVAHAFFYQQHITSVHWKNGKSHVHHEFIQEAKKDAKDGGNLKKMTQPDEYTVTENCFSIIKRLYQPSLGSAICVLINAGYNNCYLPPPEIIVA